MKRFLFSLVIVAALLSVPAYADDRLKPNTSINELTELGTGSIVSGDYLLGYDGSAVDWKKIPAEDVISLINSFEDTTATNVLTTAECGKTLNLNSATEFATTLPAETAGCFFRFIVDSAPSGASYTILTDGNDETIRGRAFDMTGGAVSAGAGVAAADTVTLVDGTAVAGDWLEAFSDGTNWNFIAFSSASGAVTFTSAQ